MSRNLENAGIAWYNLQANYLNKQNKLLTNLEVL